MNHEKLDSILDAHFAQPPVGKLDRLESDVWRRIHARLAQERPSWLEKLLAPILVPQYRIATIALAVTLGLSMGEFTKTQFLVAPPPTSTAQMLNLDVFAPNKGLLLANLTKERS